MSESEPVAFRGLPIRPLDSSELRQARLFGWFCGAAIAIGAIAVLVVGDDLRAVLAPAVACVAITLVYLAVLTRRQGQLPIFEAASYFVLATCVYTVIPLLQYVASGMQCTIHGDYRLYSWGPTPREFGGFAWRHVLLLASFVGAYLVADGRPRPLRDFVPPSRTTIIVIVALVVLFNVYFLALGAYLGPVQSVYKGGNGAEYLRLPLFIRQISNVLQIVLLTLKQSLVVLLLAHWKERRWRFVLIGWMLLEIALTVRALESRAATVILLVTFMAAFHQLVRPIRVVAAFLAGVLLLGGFLLFGVLRDLRGANLRDNTQIVRGSPTEFQILYANAYDIHMRKQTGAMPPVPRQVYLSELSRLVPSQLLPFEKIDPADWYRDLLGYGGTGMGFMFGIVAQAVIGFDWIELAIRGALLALFYAFAHRTWSRHSTSFWATVAYVFILSWAYYAFRATSFEILYRLVYYLAPAILGVKLLTLLVTRIAGMTARPRTTS